MPNLVANDLLTVLARTGGNREVWLVVNGVRKPLADVLVSSNGGAIYLFAEVDHISEKA